MAEQGPVGSARAQPRPQPRRSARPAHPARHRPQPPRPRPARRRCGPRRRLGRGRGQPALLPAQRATASSPEGREQPDPGGALPRGAGARHGPPRARHERHRPRAGARLRAAGRLPAVRRVDHAGRRRRPPRALRGSCAPSWLPRACSRTARKRPIPRWPRRIGVVTSPVGAVWRDIGNVLRRRYPLGELVLSPDHRAGGDAAPRPSCARCSASTPSRTSTRSSWPAAAARSRTCGRSTTSAWCAPWPRRRCRSSSASATSRTSPSPTSPPISARRRPAPPPSWRRRTRRSSPTILGRLRDRASTALLGRAAERRRFLDAEHGR